MSDTTESLTIVTDPAAATPVPSDDEETLLSGASDCAVCGRSASGMVPLSSCGHPICHRCRQLVLDPTVRCSKCDKVSTVPLLGDDESLTSSGPEGRGSPADEANSTSLWVSVAAGVSIAFAAWAIAAYMAKGRREATRRIVQDKARSFPFRIQPSAASPALSAAPSMSYSSFAYHARGRAVISALVAYSRSTKTI